MATCPVQWRTVRKGGDPKTDQVTRGLTHNLQAGNPKRTRPKLPTNVLLSNQRGLQHTKRGGGPKTPLCKGKGPENPGVVAPLAVAGCRGNLRRGGPIRYDVAASYYLIWYDTVDVALLGYSFLHLPLFLCSPWGSARSFSFSSAGVFQFQIASFDTLSVRENAAQFLFWVSLVLWRSTLATGW